MGFFAYKTSDTGKTFVSGHADDRDLRVETTKVATILLPNGEKFTGTYDGYGHMTNTNNQTIDIFSAVMGGIEASIADEKTKETLLREKFFHDFDGNSENIKIVENPNLTFTNVKASDQCETQGFFTFESQ